MSTTDMSCAVPCRVRAGLCVIPSYRANIGVDSLTFASGGSARLCKNSLISSVEEYIHIVASFTQLGRTAQQSLFDTKIDLLEPGPYSLYFLTSCLTPLKRGYECI